MLDAYLDESGIHDSAPICVVAGYFGGRGQWKRFESDWRELLHSSDVPLEKFHARDLVKRVGFFKPWSDGKHTRFLNGVADVIARYKVNPIGQAVLIDDFNSFTLPQRRFLTGAVVDDGRLKTSGCPSKPYFMPFQHCVRRIAQTAATTKVYFFFGADKQFAEYANTLLRDLRENSRVHHAWWKQVGPASFPLASETPQLQAADFLSYLIYRDIVERQQKSTLHLQNSPSQLVRKCLTRAVPEDIVYADKETMRGLLEKSYIDQGHWDER